MKLGYARVSTAEQNLDMQIDALREAGAERMFADKASGVATDRRGLAELLLQLRKGDCVIVWRLDRLARSLKDLIDIADKIDAAGADLVLLNEGIDTSSISGKLFFQIFGAIAEFERNLIRERTQAGLAAAKARGRTGGRRRTLTPDKQAAIDAMLAAAKANAGAPSYRSIARSIGVSERTIRRYVAGRY